MKKRSESETNSRRIRKFVFSRLWDDVFDDVRGVKCNERSTYYAVLSMAVRTAQDAINRCLRSDIRSYNTLFPVDADHIEELCRRAAIRAGIRSAHISRSHIDARYDIYLDMKNRRWHFMGPGCMGECLLETADMDCNVLVTSSTEYVLPVLDSLMPEIELKIRSQLNRARRYSMIRRIEDVSRRAGMTAED